MIPGAVLLIISASLLTLYALRLLIDRVALSALAAALICGSLAFVAALVTHEALLSAHILNAKQIRLVAAPLVEETLKMLVLLGVIAALRSRRLTDGLLLGFSVGTGFALIETGFYVVGDPYNALGIAAARSVSVHLMHSLSTTVVGLAAVYSLRHAHSFSYLVIALLIAFLNHAFNNYSTEQFGVAAFPGAVVLGIGGLVIGLLVVRAFSLRRQRSTDHLASITA